MIAEHTKLLNQERRRAASVQSVTDKMNRLTHRKSSLQKPYLVNEYSDKGEKVVTFNNSNNNTNHSTSKNKITSSNEGKKKHNNNNNKHI